MLKFAFLINVPGQSPETYSAVYKNHKSYSIIAGADGMEAGKEYIKKLVARGFTLINLCGDFDDETVAYMREDAGEGVQIDNAKYSIDELAKLNKLQSFKDYGIIIQMEGVETPKKVNLECDECITTAVFVKDLKQAKEVAAKLARRRIGFIELCGWFDRLMMEEVVNYIDGAVPIGTCGDMELTDL